MDYQKSQQHQLQYQQQLHQIWSILATQIIKNHIQQQKFTFKQKIYFQPEEEAVQDFLHRREPVEDVAEV